MIKAILFDVDGIVITARTRFFSERFAEEQGIPVEEVSAFFLNDFKKCTLGNNDLKKEVEPFLSKWKWHKGADAFLEYWFSTERTLDEHVMALIQKLRGVGYQCYLATRQERYRMEYMLDTIGLRNQFDGYFVTHEIGADKYEPTFWDAVRLRLSLAPEEILYFDDTQKNVDYANSIGIDAHFYNGIDVLEREVVKLL